MLVGREVGWCRLGRSDTRESELEVTIEFMKICVLMSPLYCDLDFLQLRSSMIDRLWGSIQEHDDGWGFELISGSSFGQEKEDLLFGACAILN
jgi:hypothetical protein